MGKNTVADVPEGFVLDAEQPHLPKPDAAIMTLPEDFVPDQVRPPEGFVLDEPQTITPAAMGQSFPEVTTLEHAQRLAANWQGAQPRPEPAITSIQPQQPAPVQNPTWRQEVHNALERGGLQTLSAIPGTAAAIAQIPKDFGPQPQPEGFWENLRKFHGRYEKLKAGEKPENGQGKPIFQGTADQLKSIAKTIYEDSLRPEIQPKKKGITGYIVNTTMETLPLMAASTVAGLTTGGVGAFATAAMAEGEAAYQNAIQHGATEDQAQTERLLVGTINGVIERAQVDKILSLGKEVGRDALRELAQTAHARAWRKLANQAGRIELKHIGKAANEGLEEALQEAVQVGAATIHGEKVELGPTARRIARAGLGGATAGYGLTGLAGAGQIATDRLAEPKQTLPATEQQPVPAPTGSAPGVATRIAPNKGTAEPVPGTGIAEATRGPSTGPAQVPSAAEAEAAAGPVEAAGKGARVQRYEEQGVSPSSPDKPQGLYLSPEEVENPHADLSGTRTVYDWHPQKPLDVTGDLRVVTPHREGTYRGQAIPASAGIKALKTLLSDDGEFQRLLNLPKRQLQAELQAKYPGVEWGRYFDGYEMLEGYAGMLAREQGYDAIMDNSGGEFAERVALSNTAISPVEAAGLPTVPSSAGAKAGGKEPWEGATVEDESRWYGTKVTVDPELKGETEFSGTVTRVLNGGKVIEVKPDGYDSVFRYDSARVHSTDLIDSGPKAALQAAEAKAPKPPEDLYKNPYKLAAKFKSQGVGRQEAYSRYVQAWGMRGEPLELDAKDFYKIYDNASIADYPDLQAQAQSATIPTMPGKEGAGAVPESPSPKAPGETAKTLPELVKQRGRQEVEELVGEWDQNAHLSEDGKFITTYSDPRNMTGKVRASTKEFLDWLKNRQPEAEPVETKPVDTSWLAEAMQKQIDAGDRPGVDAAMVESGKVKLPAGYIKEGNLYVYRPEPSPRPPGAVPPTPATATAKEEGGKGAVVGFTEDGLRRELDSAATLAELNALDEKIESNYDAFKVLDFNWKQKFNGDFEVKRKQLEKAQASHEQQIANAEKDISNLEFQRMRAAAIEDTTEAAYTYKDRKDAGRQRRALDKQIAEAKKALDALRKPTSSPTPAPASGETGEGKGEISPRASTTKMPVSGAETQKTLAQNEISSTGQPTPATSGEKGKGEVVAPSGIDEAAVKDLSTPKVPAMTDEQIAAAITRHAQSRERWEEQRREYDAWTKSTKPRRNSKQYQEWQQTGANLKQDFDNWKNTVERDARQANIADMFKMIRQTDDPFKKMAIADYLERQYGKPALTDKEIHDRAQARYGQLKALIEESAKLQGADAETAKNIAPALATDMMAMPLSEFYTSREGVRQAVERANQRKREAAEKEKAEAERQAAEAKREEEAKIQAAKDAEIRAQADAKWAAEKDAILKREPWEAKRILPGQAQSQEEGVELFADMASYLGRPLSESEQRILYAPRLKMTNIRDAGDDFVVAVRNSKDFQASVRDEAAAEYMRRHGVELLQPPKVADTKPIKTESDVLDALQTHSSTESGRYAINGFNATPTELASTDGRRLLVLTNKWNIQPGVYRFLGKGQKLSYGPLEGNFPKYEVIIPKDVQPDFLLTGEQADQLLSALDYSKKQQRLSYTGDADDRRTFATIEGGEVTIHLNAGFLSDSIWSLRRAGASQITAHIDQGDRPILLTGTRGNEKIGQAVIMPVNEPERALNITPMMGKKLKGESAAAAPGGGTTTQPAPTTAQPQGASKATAAPGPGVSKEAMMAFDDLRSSRVKYNSHQTKAAERVEILSHIKELRSELQSRGFKAEYIKAVEGGTKPVPGTTTPSGSRPGFAGAGRSALTGVPPEIPKPPQPPEQTPQEPSPAESKQVRPLGAIREKLQSLYQHYLNRFQSIEDLDKRAAEIGIKPEPGARVGILARSYLGIANKVKTTLEDGTYRLSKDGSIETTGESLKVILDDWDKGVSDIESDRGIRERDLDDYGNALRAIYDLQRKPYEGARRNIVTQKQVAMYQAMLEDLRSKYGNKANLLDEISQRRTDYRNRLLHLLVDSGNLSEAQYNKITKENPHYTPWDRVLDSVEGGFLPKARQLFTKARAPIRRIKGGSELEISNTTESDIKNTYRIMDAVDRNRVALGVKGYMKYFKEIVPVRVKMMPIRVDPKEIDTIRREFHQRVRPIIEETRQTKTSGTGAAASEATGPMAKLETVVREALMHRGMTEGEAGNYIRKLKQSASTPTTPGETVTIETQIRKVIRESERIITETLPVETTIFRPSQFAPKGRVIEYFENGKRRYMEVPQNLYEAMTGLNETGLSLLTKILATPANLLRTGATLTLEFMSRNPIRDQWSALMNTQIGSLPFVDATGALADIIGNKKAYQDWMRVGGSYSGFVELSRPALKKAMQELRSPRSVKLLRKLNIVTTAQELSQLMEQATRVGVYKRAVKSGLSPLEGGFVSREGTVDFGRRGSKMKDINAALAFFNAGVQAFDRSVRAAKADPLGFTIKGIAAITIPSLLLYLRNRDDPEYEELPRWQRDLFWCIHVSGTWIRIPKPFLYGQVFGSIPERYAEYVDKHNPKALDGLAKSIWDSISPVQGDQAGGLLATAIKPLIENATNWNFFRERPLVPEAKKNLLPEEQYGRYTSATAKWLGERFHYSPAKIENLVTGYFGGSGQYALDAGDYLVDEIRKAQGESERPSRPRELADIPLVRGFVARPPASGTAQSIQDFYDQADRIGALYSTWRKLIAEGNDTKASGMLRDHPELIVGPEVSKYRTTISEAANNVDAVVRSKTMTMEDKRRAIAKIENDRLDAVHKSAIELSQIPKDSAAVNEWLMSKIAATTYIETGRDQYHRLHRMGEPFVGQEEIVQQMKAEWQRRTGRTLSRAEIRRAQIRLARQERKDRIDKMRQIRATGRP